MSSTKGPRTRRGMRSCESVNSSGSSNTCKSRGDIKRGGRSCTSQSTCGNNSNNNNNTQSSSGVEIVKCSVEVEVTGIGMLKKIAKGSSKNCLKYSFRTENETVAHLPSSAVSLSPFKTSPSSRSLCVSLSVLGFCRDLTFPPEEIKSLHSNYMHEGKLTIVTIRNERIFISKALHSSLIRLVESIQLGSRCTSPSSSSMLFSTSSVSSASESLSSNGLAESQLENCNFLNLLEGGDSPENKLLRLGYKKVIAANLPGLRETSRTFGGMATTIDSRRRRSRNRLKIFDLESAEYPESSMVVPSFSSAPNVFTSSSFQFSDFSSSSSSSSVSKSISDTQLSMSSSSPLSSSSSSSSSCSVSSFPSPTQSCNLNLPFSTSPSFILDSSAEGSSNMSQSSERLLQPQRNDLKRFDQLSPSHNNVSPISLSFSSSTLISSASLSAPFASSSFASSTSSSTSTSSGHLREGEWYPQPTCQLPETRRSSRNVSLPPDQLQLFSFLSSPPSSPSTSVSIENRKNNRKNKNVSQNSPSTVNMQPVAKKQKTLTAAAAQTATPTTSITASISSHYDSPTCWPTAAVTSQISASPPRLVVNTSDSLRPTLCSTYRTSSSGNSNMTTRRSRRASIESISNNISSSDSSNTNHNSDSSNTNHNSDSISLNMNTIGSNNSRSRSSLHIAGKVSNAYDKASSRPNNLDWFRLLPEDVLPFILESTMHDGLAVCSDFAKVVRSQRRRLVLTNLRGENVPPARIIKIIQSSPEIRILDLSGFNVFQPSHLESLSSSRSAFFPLQLQVVAFRNCTRLTDKSVRSFFRRLSDLRAADLTDCFQLTAEAVAPLRLLTKLQRVALGGSPGARGCSRQSNETVQTLCGRSFDSALLKLDDDDDDDVHGKIPPSPMEPETSITTPYVEGEKSHENHNESIVPHIRYDCNSQKDPEEPVKDSSTKSYCPPLRMLLLTCCSKVTSIFPLLNCRHTLDFLDLRGCAIDDSNAPVLAALTRLTVLVLANTNISSVTLKAIARHCRKLEFLDLSRLADLSSEVLRFSTLQLKSLKRLKLSYVTNFNNICFQVALAQLPALQFLEASGCWRLTTQVLDVPGFQVAAGKTLRKIGIEGCSIERHHFYRSLLNAGASQVQLSIHHELKMFDVKNLYVNMKLDETAQKKQMTK